MSLLDFKMGSEEFDQQWDNKRTLATMTPDACETTVRDALEFLEDTAGTHDANTDHVNNATVAIIRVTMLQAGQVKALNRRIDAANKALAGMAEERSVELSCDCCTGNECECSGKKIS